MSFTGDLEHLPIVDVIQLLHATRKSGILRVSSRKGESQLVFKDGFIVSANHLNNSVRIGQILVDLGLISDDLLHKTLEEQKSAGHDRKPLIITLIEKGAVNERDAYKGLEQLIEMTLVEILSWKGGTFMLDVMPQSVADEYRYFPEKMNREINVDTQGILMNALRIFDEKMRDGGIPEEESEGDEFPDVEFNLVDSPPEAESQLISADDLGLDALDSLRAPTPEVYRVLEDRDPKSLHMQAIERAAPELLPGAAEELAEFLLNYGSSPEGDKEGEERGWPPRDILFYGSDDMLKHIIATLCKKGGGHLLATNEDENLDPIIDRSLADGKSPILVLDSCIGGDAGITPEQLTALRRRVRNNYPPITMIQLSLPHEDSLATEAYLDGVRAVMPRPFQKENRETYVADVIRFVNAFSRYLHQSVPGHGLALAGLKECFAELKMIKGAPDAAFVLLKFVARTFARAATLIVRDRELVAEKGIGIMEAEGRGVTPAMGFRIALSSPSIFTRVIGDGRVFYGKGDDHLLREQWFSQIGEPVDGGILLLPLRFQGKTISITYGDFGGKGTKKFEVAALELLACHAEIALENAMYRKSLKKHPSESIH